MTDTAPPSARYSRIVRILKIVLPLSALVLLSLVFVLARTVDPTQGIRQASVDVQELARDPRLTGAHFAGVTDDGAALTISTETARSDPNAALRLEVTGLRLQIDGPQGETFSAQAAHGIIDRQTGHFEMDGDVRIEASPGYRLVTARLAGLLDSTHIYSPGSISGSAPAGQISAGTMTMRAKSGPDAGYTLVFGGGVRLLYQPEN